MRTLVSALCLITVAACSSTPTLEQEAKDRCERYGLKNNLSCVMYVGEKERDRRSAMALTTTGARRD